MVRVRIAPSPSGSIHIGNVRTALFNFLFAKQNKGEFILRIEDTDQERVVENGANNILNDLVWLGLIPTEGFGTKNKPFQGGYTQMERLEIYRHVAHKLVEKGLAYKCYCTEEELNKKREEALSKNPKSPFKYPGTCRNSENQDKPYVIRFKAPTEGSIEFDDIVFGKSVVPNKENFDFVIMRSNGIPLYNFACVVDDGINDKITHVIRGADHLKNMPQQLLLYKALELAPPKFAHLPMILNKTGGKLSKRDTAVSIAEYRKMGYTPGGILNYLAKFGWAYGNQEVFSIDDLINKFSLETCNKKDGKFDPEKFTAIQYEHLRENTLMSNYEYADYLSYIFKDKGISSSATELEKLVYTVRNKAKTLLEAADKIDFIFHKEVSISPENKEVFSKDNMEKLGNFANHLSLLPCWTEEILRNTTKDWMIEHNLLLKDLGQPIRLALTGKTITPELFQVMEILGRNTTLKRLSEIRVRE